MKWIEMDSNFQKYSPNIKMNPFQFECIFIHLYLKLDEGNFTSFTDPVINY